MKQLFLDTLALLGNKAGGKRLKEALPGWTEEQYSDTLKSLIEDGTLKIGRGRGGSVQVV